MQIQQALPELLIKIADDELIIGHRNSEWTGLGPVMEEDIAFSSMAQDKIGHAWAIYRILQEHFEGQDPDQFAFMRDAAAYKCCHLVEMPIGAYEFSLMRHFLFDHAETARYQSFSQSSFTPLQQLAGKIKGELKYHTLHADAWILQLCKAGEESRQRMQGALDDCFQLAGGIFEPGKEEALLISENIYPGEQALYQQWLSTISPVIEKAGLIMPQMTAPVYGGRQGQHTQYLQQLLNEMGEVFRLDPEATW
ncbi:1,2-phenylacetyl-CoA epoxidase subunit PaaC [Chitinophaga rhizophila]|uniref:Phenylacetate-CoA oxygenase subunit PaaC n=1 Tax=Chitinophaga rhizophila TaxID=2866212 RepID=A0ABS7GFX1_9BACT|nr:1,2-phenylacetyl-CoA epoxidase subunit PaaC [Chitinophaga rhizophila]MBW8686145.1 phenylacetate-CoA oxygenase subunit PaaC [Chitinophaga rhizophila]